MLFQSLITAIRWYKSDCNPALILDLLGMENNEIIAEKHVKKLFYFH